MAPTSLGGGLASDLGEGVLRKAGIENSIGNLVAVSQEELLVLESTGWPLAQASGVTQQNRWEKKE